MLAGLVVGGLGALAYLLGGPFTLLLGLAAWAWLLARHGSLPVLAATLVGFGAVWVLLMGKLLWACAIDPTCGPPSFSVVWIAIGVVILTAGILLSLAANSRVHPN